MAVMTLLCLHSFGNVIYNKADYEQYDGRYSKEFITIQNDKENIKKQRTGYRN